MAISEEVQEIVTFVKDSITEAKNALQIADTVSKLEDLKQVLNGEGDTITSWKNHRTVWETMRANASEVRKRFSKCEKNIAAAENSVGLLLNVAAGGGLQPGLENLKKKIRDNEGLVQSFAAWTNRILNEMDKINSEMYSKGDETKVAWGDYQQMLQNVINDLSNARIYNFDDLIANISAVNQ